MNCPACSAVLVAGQRFCTTCGGAAPAMPGVAAPTGPDLPRTAAPTRVRYVSWGVDFGVVIAATLIVSLASDVLGLIAGVAGGPAYYVLAELRGGTLGHRVTKTRVIDTETGAGAPVTSLGIRLAVIAGLLLPLAIPFLANAVLMATRPGWSSVHDVCARSEVR